MKKAKIIIPIVFLAFMIIIGFNSSSVYASNVGVDISNRDNSRYLATGAGSDIDHSAVTYSVDGEQAYCIQAGIAIRSSYTYAYMYTIYDPRFSWIIYSSASQDLKQAAVWELAGQLGYGSYVTNKDQELIDFLAQADREGVGASAANAAANFASDRFTYSRAGNEYVSPTLTIENSGSATINGDNGSAYFRGMDGSNLGRSVGSGQYTIVIPATTVTQDMSISVTAHCNSEGVGYGGALVYGDGDSGHQLVIKPSMSTVHGDDATSASISLTAVGDMKVVKKDEHGVPVQGAVFRVQGGPDNINTTITTDANGEAQLLEQRIGNYQIKEESVPATLVLNEREFTITVTSGAMVSYNFENEYERGELSVAKEDVFKRLGKKNYGDGNFAEIKVGLYAAEDIYEGTTKVLSANQKVAERVLNAAGQTRSVKEFTRQDGKYFDGLPLGKYYWKEEMTNEAYLMPSDATVVEAKKEKYDQEITYLNMNTPYVPNKSITIYDQEVYTKVIVYKMDNDNSNAQGGNDTDHSPAEGAVLRLTLKSNYNETTKAPIDSTHDTYTATVNEYGKAEFKNPEFETLYANTGISMEYTIPFGTYVLDEIQTSNNGQSYFYGIQDVDIIAKENNHTYRPIVMDEPIPIALELVKIDIDDDDQNGTVHETVPVNGAKFKIWDLQTNDWLVQRMPNSDDTIDEYVTNNAGHCILPQKVYAGEYVVYETYAPKGYYINEELRIPTKENGEIDTAKLGDSQYGGKYIDIRNVSVNVSDAEEYPEGEGILDLDYIRDNLSFTVELGDNTTRGNIDVFKMGEVFADFTSSTSAKYEDDGYTEELTEYSPKYEMQALANCTFEVWAVEDATTVDGRVKEEANSKIHKIVTDSTGHGICRNEDGTEDKLFCNPETGTRYHIREVDCPAGYDLAEDQEVVVFPGTEYKQVEMKGLEIHDTYLPFQLKLDKNFVRENEDGVMFKPANEYDRDPAIAIFGIYSKQDLHSTNGKEIPKDTLIQTLKVVEGEGYIESYKLPDGDYYIEELYTSEPYTIIDEETKEPHVYDFKVEHKKGVTTPQLINVNADNTYPTGDLYVVKISSTKAVQAGGLTLKSTDEGYEEVREFTEMYSTRITEMLMSGEIDVDRAIADVTRAFNLDRTDFEIMTPAQYGVYVDLDCTIPLQQSTDDGQTYTNVVLTPMQVTENGRTYYNGVYSVKGIQEGTYYLKELVAPTYMDRKGKVRKYDLSKDITVVEVKEDTVSNEECVVLRVLTDDIVRYEIQKTDIFTDEGIPNCLFTITDEAGNELLRFVTNEEGQANIPTDIFQDGETYYFTEIDAPKYPYYDGDVLYELNTEPHKFIAHVDENSKWKMEFENEDGDTEEYELIKIQNFRTRTDVELTKLDMVDSTPIPNCHFILKGIDTDFEEEGITDENGIYIFKDVPYGKYTYTELEAPEGWMIDTTPHEFTLDSHGTKIVVYDERAIDVDTGDIAVAAIAVIAVVSVAGIVFVAIRKKKANSAK